jgi:hypothetical protein
MLLLLEKLVPILYELGLTSVLDIDVSPPQIMDAPDMNFLGWVPMPWTSLSDIPGFLPSLAQLPKFKGLTTTDRVALFGRIQLPRVRLGALPNLPSLEGFDLDTIADLQIPSFPLCALPGFELPAAVGDFALPGVRQYLEGLALPSFSLGKLAKFPLLDLRNPAIYLPAIPVPVCPLGDFPGLGVSVLQQIADTIGEPSFGLDALRALELPAFTLGSVPDFELACAWMTRGLDANGLAALEVPSFGFADAFSSLDVAALAPALPAGVALSPADLLQHLRGLQFPTFRLGAFPGMRLPQLPGMGDLALPVLPAAPTLPRMPLHLQRIGGSLMKVKLLLGFVQCLSFIPSTLRSVPWPDAFVDLSRVLNLASVDVLAAFGNICQFNTGYLSRFTFQLLIMPFSAVLTVLAYVLVRLLGPRCCAKRFAQVTPESLRTRLFELNFLVVYTLCVFLFVIAFDVVPPCSSYQHDSHHSPFHTQHQLHLRQHVHLPPVRLQRGAGRVVPHGRLYRALLRGRVEHFHGAGRAGHPRVHARDPAGALRAAAPQPRPPVRRRVPRGRAGQPRRGQTPARGRLRGLRAPLVLL